MICFSLFYLADIVFQVKKNFFPDYILPLAAGQIMLFWRVSYGCSWNVFSVIQTCRHDCVCLCVRVCVRVYVCVESDSSSF